MYLFAGIVLCSVLRGCSNETSFYIPTKVKPEPSTETEEAKQPIRDGYNPDGKKDSSYLPFGENGTLGRYQRAVPDDKWHPSAAIIGRSFDLLTPTGKLIFERAVEFIEDQKDPQFQDFAQPLRCTTNLTYVLNSIGYQFQGSALHSIPYFLQAVKDIGGVVYNLPRYNKAKNNRHEIVSFFNTAFPHGVPAGAIIAGCTTSNCMGSKPDGGHIGILGDKNEYGELMIYHNNWLRPNNLKGQRIPYMVSLQNLYVERRPREWMPTPWVYFLKDNKGKIKDMVSLLPQLDDLDPLNHKYQIKIALLPEIVYELRSTRFLPHHRHLTTANPHINYMIHEKRWEICRSRLPLKKQDIRLSPNGKINTDITTELKDYKKDETFLDYRFEFVPIGQEEGWVSALVYDAGRYWGEGDTFGAIWLPENQITCRAKGTSH
ncbi:MAG: hypothetical protein OXC44_07155 [Proteobacteria bacterium]|nr:hypothetical protein [Pseudomonadota bacterium]